MGGGLGTGGFGGGGGQQCVRGLGPGHGPAAQARPAKPCTRPARPPPTPAPQSPPCHPPPSSAHTLHGCKEGGGWRSPSLTLFPPLTTMDPWDPAPPAPHDVPCQHRTTTALPRQCRRTATAAHRGETRRPQGTVATDTFFNTLQGPPTRPPLPFLPPKPRFFPLHPIPQNPPPPPSPPTHVANSSTLRMLHVCAHKGGNHQPI
jgi:hypothetical protein